MGKSKLTYKLHFDEASMDEGRLFVCFVLMRISEELECAFGVVGKILMSMI
jgi:hypothetical protein